MGYNTTVLILNDAWGQIMDNPDEFVAKLNPLISGGLHHELRRQHQGLREIGSGGVDISVGNHCNAATVICNEHADQTHVILVGGNYATDLGTAWTYKHHTKESMQSALNAVLDQYGLKVVDKE